MSTEKKNCTSEEDVELKKKDMCGSRYRCLQLTHLGKEEVFKILTELCKNDALKVEFDENKDNFYPQGYFEAKELMLTNVDDEVIKEVLTDEIQDILWDWWLKEGNKGTRTPNWDIITTCKIDGKRGLLLVEAKAHHAEIKDSANKKEINADNRAKIEGALDKASDELSAITKLSFKLERGDYYQLSNRFAWSWKLAEQGIPVVLVYLGFINAYEMNYGGRKLFTDHDDFVEAMTTGEPAKIVDPDVWGKKLDIPSENGEKTPFIALLKSMEFEPKIYSK